MMQNSRLPLAVCGVFWIFIVFSSSRVFGENLFRWTDDAGRSHYSNVSPPAGVKKYSVDVVSRVVSDRSSPAGMSNSAKTEEKISAEADGPRSGFSTAYLDQRIADRRRSIGHIEALLRKHPNDAGLRKNLSKKRRYLLDDLTRLKNNPAVTEMTGGEYVDSE